MRKTKILQLAYNYGNSISYICNEYSRSLDRNRHCITVAFLFGAPDQVLAKNIDADNVMFLNYPKREIGGLRINALKGIIRLCKQHRYDVIVCHRYKAAQFISIVRLFCHIPHILFTVHTIGYLSDLRRKIFAFLFFRYFTYIAISNAVREDLLKNRIGLSEESVITVHNTVDIKALTAAQLDGNRARAKLGFAHGDFIFGTVGRLVAFKDHVTLIKAFALAYEKLNNAKLIIIGEGKLEVQLKRLVEREGMSACVVFPGKIPDAYSYMKAFDIFVLSSIREPFGLVLLEAMAAERPIICSRSGGPPEIVGSFAMMVDEHSPKGFATQMISAYRLTAVERARMGNCGYRHLQEHFTQSKFAQLIAALEHTS